MTFRRRILIAMLPLFALLVALGGTGAALIYHLGGQIDLILRENYDSVIYMRDLNEALERINSSFLLALAGQEEQAHRLYQDKWKLFDDSLDKENHNITILPEEGQLVDKLTTLSKDYRQAGNDFFAHPGAQRKGLYFASARAPCLYSTFVQIKNVSDRIRQINQDQMEHVNAAARVLALHSLVWYGSGLAFGIALAVLLVASTIRTILYPIRAVTESAAAIGAGNLDQLVPITSNDELGQLASSFNTMARQLRELRQSHHAQLVRAQQTSQATIDSFPDPVLVVDPEQHVEMANPVARRLLGVRPREDRKQPPVIWEPPEALRQPLLAAVREQHEYLPEGFDKAVVLQVGEQSHSFLPRILPIRDSSGVTLGAAVLLEDITRFRLLDEVKSNLVATVSHELKTPLTSLRIVLHLLLEEGVGPLLPKQLELLIDARDNAERLLVMINNLLDLARLEQGQNRLRLRPEQPALLLHSAAEPFQARAQDQGVELIVEAADDLPLVAVDAEQFQHALHNLLDNSLRHTPQGGQITLAAQACDGKIVFSVADTGSGIPAVHLPLVFERYFRVPGDTVPGGSGLGLAIVREIVLAHGGAVACQSAPGVKTVFRLTLPASEASAASPSPSGRGPG